MGHAVVLNVMGLITGISIGRRVRVRAFPFDARACARIGFQRDETCVLAIVVIGLAVSIVVRRARIAQLYVELSLVAILVRVHVGFLLTLRCAVHLCRVRVACKVANLNVDSHSFNVEVRSLPFVAASICFHRFVLSGNNVSACVVVRVTCVVAIVR